MDPRRALSFGAAASSYALARPAYPQEAVSFVLPPEAARVLDLGAGTGKLTSVLLSAGLEVIAVEPDAEMRALIDPRADVRAGTAEDVPVSDGSVDAVFVAQAWHWFEPVAALASVRRVLRPGGALGLLWNVLDDSSGWARDLAELVGTSGLEDKLSLIRHLDAPTDEAGAFGTWTRSFIPNGQPADVDLLLANLTSRSAVILMSEQERSALFAAVREVVPAGSFTIPWVTNAWTARLPD